MGTTSSPLVFIYATVTCLVGAITYDYLDAWDGEFEWPRFWPNTYYINSETPAEFGAQDWTYKAAITIPSTLFTLLAGLATYDTTREMLRMRRR